MVLLTAPTGGRRYFRVADLINRNAQIIDEAVLEEVAFTRSDSASDVKTDIRKVLRVPVRVKMPATDAANNSSITTEVDGIWTPGIFAQIELQKELGNETKNWIGAEGIFEERRVEDKNGKRYLAVFFRVTKKPSPSQR